MLKKNNFRFWLIKNCRQHSNCRWGFVHTFVFQQWYLGGTDLWRYCVFILPVCASSSLKLCLQSPLFFTFPLHTDPYSSSADLLSPVRLNLMETLHLGLSIPRSFTLYEVHLWVSWIHLALSAVEGNKYDSICILHSDIHID